MSALEDRVEAAIIEKGITDAEEEQTVAPVNPEPKEKEAPKEGDTKDDKKPEAPKYDKDGKRIEDESEQESEKEDKKVDDGEFTADDALEVEETKTPEAPPTDAAGVILSQAEQKYVVDNIGDPMVIRGVRGTGDDAKEVELKVFDPTQIPKDFQFSSQADLLAAQQGFQRLENKAQQLLGNFRNEQSQTQASDFEKRENEGIRQDVAELQKDGFFPKFKIQPGQKGFDDDPAAQQMSEVLNIMTKTNEQYMKEYQQGRPYKHIGFKEAFDISERLGDSKKKETAQKDEDQERKEIANKVGSGKGLSTSKIVKPTIKHGTTTRDILNRIENGDF
jgi:hypothetical protein